MKQSSSGRSDTDTSNDNLDVRDDLGGAIGNLRGDTEHLEGGISGLQFSIANWKNDVLGGPRHQHERGAATLEDLTDAFEVIRCKNKVDVSTDAGEETLALRVLRKDGARGVTGERQI